MVDLVKRIRVGGLLAVAVALMMIACGDDDSTDGTSGDDTRAVSAEVQACIDGCGDGCPAPQDRHCASDGNRYCSTCVIGCHGLTTAGDESICDADTSNDSQGGDQSHDTEKDDDWERTPTNCLLACGGLDAKCPAPDEYPCATDGKTYCNECVIECLSLEISEDPNLCK